MSKVIKVLGSVVMLSISFPVEVGAIKATIKADVAGSMVGDKNIADLITIEADNIVYKGLPIQDNRAARMNFSAHMSSMGVDYKKSLCDEANKILTQEVMNDLISDFKLVEFAD